VVATSRDCRAKFIAVLQQMTPEVASMGMLEELLRTNLIDIGEVKIARATTRLGGVEGRERYLIYLPTSRAYLWRALHDMGGRVRVWIEIPQKLKAKLQAQ
jgi:hypothetical protein